MSASLSHLMRRRKFPAILLLLGLIASSVLAADINYPYGSISLTLPPAEDPIPGFGGAFSALPLGLKSVLVNPATLGKLKLAEASLLISTTAGLSSVSRTTNVNELGGTFEGGSYGLFFRTPANISGFSTREISVASNLNYSTIATEQKFSSALKVNDWLIIGFMTGNPFGSTVDLAGNFPLTTKGKTSLYGQTLGQMQIENNGKLKYTFNSTTTYESTKPLWSGFISQEAVMPLTTASNLRNNMDFQSPFTATIAGGSGHFHAGLNVIPLTASANIDNVVREYIPAGTSNISIYIPNFDPNNQTAVQNWISDSNHQYDTSNGYVQKQLQLPAGALVGEAKYHGVYSASTARLDLGLMYDPSEWVSFGLDFENLGGAALDFKGSGLAGYISYRNLDTAEAGNLTTLLQPGGPSTITLLPDQWTTTFEAGGTKLFLEPDKIYSLPKKIRLGLALKRPFLIALDYEQNSNSITVPGSNATSNLVIGNLSFIRFGFESRIFFLPWWLRFGTTLMLKPTIAGANASTQDSINKAFKYKVLPTRLDLGSSVNFWSYELSGACGVNAMPMLNLLQFDTQNADPSRMVYYSLGLKKGAWEVNYLNAVDALSTAAAYSNKPAPADGSKKQFEFSDIKYVQTLGVTYRF